MTRAERNEACRVLDRVLRKKGLDHVVFAGKNGTSMFASYEPVIESMAALFMAARIELRDGPRPPWYRRLTRRIVNVWNGEA